MGLQFGKVYGEYVNGSISDEERKKVLKNSCPGAGACGGMYTANTMATAIETLGMSLPYRYLLFTSKKWLAIHNNMYTYMWINVYICMDVYMVVYIPDVKNGEEQVQN